MSNQRSSLDNLEKDVNEKLEIVFDKDQKSLATLLDALTKIEQRIETVHSMCFLTHFVYVCIHSLYITMHLIYILHFI
jgi:hypothetical protein